MQIWGHCRPCGMWFAVAEDTVQALVATQCSRCGHVPEALEQRLGDLVIALDVSGARAPQTPMEGVA